MTNQYYEIQLNLFIIIFVPYCLCADLMVVH